MDSKPHFDVAKRCFDEIKEKAQEQMDRTHRPGQSVPPATALILNLSVALGELTRAVEMELSEIRASLEAISRRPRRVK